MPRARRGAFRFSLPRSSRAPLTSLGSPPSTGGVFTHDPGSLAVLNRITVPGALALALLSATQSWAASDVDLDAIRQEIRDLKANYEARTKALEERLQEAEARAAQAQQPPPAVIAAPSTPTSSLSAFNPAISVVLQGRYANLSRDPAGFAIPGFTTGGEIGPGRRGLSLSEWELVVLRTKPLAGRPPSRAGSRAPGRRRRSPPRSGSRRRHRRAGVPTSRRPLRAGRVASRSRARRRAPRSRGS